MRKLISVTLLILVITPAGWAGWPCMDRLIPWARRIHSEIEILWSSAHVRSDSYTDWRALRQQPWDRTGSFGVLQSYENQLGSLFVDDLRALRPGQHWMDVGMGQGNAIREYLTDPFFPNKARITGIAVRSLPRRRLREFENLASSVQFVFGQYFEDIDLSSLELADIISDVYGALHYSPWFDRVLAKELDALKVGGRFYSSAPLFLTIESERGEVALLDFLQSIEGVRIIVSARRQEIAGFALEKLSPNVRVPRLSLIEFHATKPPIRKYRWSRIN